MKILYLCPDLGIPVLGRKGASVHVRSLVTAFDRAGHSIVLAAPVLSKSPWDEPARLKAPLLHLPPSGDVQASVRSLKVFNETLGGCANSLPGELSRILYDRELRTQLKQRFACDPPDFIYERASLYSTVGVSLARVLDRPLLVELNAPLAMEQTLYRSSMLGDLAAQAERWMLSQADAVLAVSIPLRDYVLSLGVEPGAVHVLPNGVDPELFQPGPPDAKIRARWGLGKGPVLGFISGLRPWHDVATLPALLARLLQRHRDLRLVVVGDGPLRVELEREVRERGLTPNIVFTGALPHEEVADLTRQFDVALAPYPRPEHAFYFSPLKLFEYMACGIPVVAAKLEQIAEVVRDGETGLLYPPGEIDALAAACDRLLTDPELRRRLGRAAAKEVRGRYTWDHNAARVVEMARSLLAARGTRCARDR